MANRMRHWQRVRQGKIEETKQRETMRKWKMCAPECTYIHLETWHRHNYVSMLGLSLLLLFVTDGTERIKWQLRWSIRQTRLSSILWIHHRSLDTSTQTPDPTDWTNTLPTVSILRMWGEFLRMTPMSRHNTPVRILSISEETFLPRDTTMCR